MDNYKQRYSESPDEGEVGLNESSKRLLPNGSDEHRRDSGDQVWHLKPTQPPSASYLTDESVGSSSPFRRSSDSSGTIQQSDGISDCRKHLSVVILFLINLLNYMDRFTIAGVLVQIQGFFDISDADAGLLQTVFVVSYMIVAPLFGYLGDRYNRKLIMFCGIIFWSGSTLGASFIYDPKHYGWFVMFRALVGIGEASYSTIAPTIIGDMFVGPKRTYMLASFFFAIPVGSGLGYVAGSGAASLFGSWHWALRVTPGIGIVVVLLMLIVIPDVKRGASDASRQNALNNLDEVQETTTYIQDLKYVLSNTSFMFITCGFTFMAFMAGSLSFWGPNFVAYSQVVAGNLLPCTAHDCEYSSISFTFGVVLCLSGFCGVLFGSLIARKWSETRKNSDAFICAIGLLVSGPSVLIGFELATKWVVAAWVFIFTANLFMCFTWTPCTDMTLYVTMPSRRSTANAVQILILHLFGDAGSPYIIGLISDYLQKGKPDTYVTKYEALKHAFYITPFMCVLGGGCFLFASIFIFRDRKRVEDALKGPSSATTGSSPVGSNSDVAVELATTSHRVSTDSSSAPSSSTDKIEHQIETTDETTDGKNSPEYLKVRKQQNTNNPAGEDESSDLCDVTLITPRSSSSEISDGSDAPLITSNS